MVRCIYELIRKIKYPFLFFKKIKIKWSSSVSKDVFFEGNNVVGRHCILRNSSIGFGTYMGDNCIISGTKIGRYCSIAYGLKILVGKHPTTKHVSTHPAFFSTRKQAGFSYVNESTFEEIDYLDLNKNLYVTIGSDVWIGTDVKIKGGVKIGDGAVIGAGAIVLHDVKPYEIVAGIPAKRISQRFTDDEQFMLQAFKWWNKDVDWLKNHIELFSDINKMKEWVKKNEI